MERQSMNGPDRTLDSAIEALKNDTAPQASQDIVNSIALPSPSRPGRRTTFRWVLAGALGVSGGIALWPHGTKGVAWSDVLLATKSAQVVHSKTLIYDKDGHESVGGETWVEGKKYRFTAPSHQEDYGRFDLRDDGKQLTQMRIYGKYWVVTPTNPRSQLRSESWIGQLDIQQLLNNKEMPVTVSEHKQNVEFRGESFDCYQLKYKYSPPVGQFYVDPITNRIRYVKTPLSLTTYEYPNSIDAKNFEPPTDTEYPVHYIDKEFPILQKLILKGYGRKTVKGHSVVLRAVLPGPYNQVAVLWTGTPPDGNMADRVSVLGRKVTYAFGARCLTSTIYRYTPKNHLCQSFLKSDFGEWCCSLTDLLEIR